MLRLISFFILFILSYNISFAENNKYEWRAVWISTVNNIDWPSKPGLSADDQKKELLEYLDLFQSLNFNAIVLQIRPTADAFYRSEYEPWSIYLTGNQEIAPQPTYDPLQFAIEQAHKRGMELHGWLNPYRITQDTANLKDIAQDHIYRTNPELFVRHGKKAYFDPGFPESRDFVTTVVKDIVRRYDIDGIHFDDYFYPDNNLIDTLSFSLHNRGYSAEEKHAWRRENVDLLVEQINKEIKDIKPYVKFGISPFAVWRNIRDDQRGSDTKCYGYTNYDNLHADVLKWLENKWVDYILPQFYFEMGNKSIDFITIKDWWQENSFGIPLYAGLGPYKLDKGSKVEAYRTNQEIANQIDSIRATEGYLGECYFTANNFTNNILDINSVIKEKYPHKALSPNILPYNNKYSTPIPPVNPIATYSTNNNKTSTIKLSWTKYPDSYFFVIYKSPKGNNLDINNASNIVAITGESSYTINDSIEKDFDYYITALSRYAIESKPQAFKKQGIIAKTLKKNK